MRTMAAVIVCALAMSAGAADTWPDYRGPLQNGHAEGARIARTWSEAQNVTWKTAIDGKGWSSPVVACGLIWMTTAIEEPDGAQSLYAVSVDLATGKNIRKILIERVAEPQPIHRFNSYASPSPIIDPADPARVYVHFGTFATACIDADDGRVLWKRNDLHIDHMVGPGSSPVLYGDLLILQYDGVDHDFMTAMDRATGRTVWQVDRSMDFSHVRVDQRKAFGTPIFVEVDGKTQLIIQAAQALYGYDPQDGAELWRFDYDGYSNVPRLVPGDGLVYLSTGYDNADMVAIKLGGRGNITKTHEAWRLPRRQVPRRASPILVNGALYMVSDGGVMQCLDAQTGEVHWRERLGGNYTACPIYAGGRLYFFNEAGDCAVIKPGVDGLHVEHTNTLESGFMASPAVVGDALILRTKTHLYRIDAP